VTDSSSPALDTTASLTLAVVAPLAVTTTALPTVTTGVPYTAPLAATGGVPPYTWLVGGLPPGLTLDPATGVISGTATELGNYSITVQVTDSNSPPTTATTDLSIVVAAPLDVTTTNLPDSETGEPYSAGLSASGGVPPYTWTAVSGLPAGLSLDSGTGVVSGEPSAQGGYSITVDVTDSADPASTTQATVGLFVHPGLAIGTVVLPHAEVGQFYQAQVQAGGGVDPLTYSVSDSGILPPGIQVSPNTGLILCTPEIPGDFSFQIQVTDSDSPPATVSANEEIDVAPQLQIISPVQVPPVIQNGVVDFQLSALGGYQPYTWSAPGLPPALVLLPNGQIFGPATVPGTFGVLVTVTDTYDPPAFATQNLIITVLPVASPDGQVRVMSGRSRVQFGE
jgi:hypothetical protein